MLLSHIGKEVSFNVTVFPCHTLLEMIFINKLIIVEMFMLTHFVKMVLFNELLYESEVLFVLC